MCGALSISEKEKKRKWKQSWPRWRSSLFRPRGDSLFAVVLHSEPDLRHFKSWFGASSTNGAYFHVYIFWDFKLHLWGVPGGLGIRWKLLGAHRTDASNSMLHVMQMIYLCYRLVVEEFSMLSLGSRQLSKCGAREAGAIVALAPSNSVSAC